jgi:hypothetical protein
MPFESCHLHCQPYQRRSHDTVHLQLRGSCSVCLAGSSIAFPGITFVYSQSYRHGEPGHCTPDQAACYAASPPVAPTLTPTKQPIQGRVLSQ